MAFTTDFSGDYEDVLQRYSTSALQQAEDVAGLEYTPYTGERIAGFSPTELAGRERASELAQMGLGMPQVQQAADVMTGLAGYEAGTYDPRLLSQANVQEYMSPYLEGALDPTLRAIREQQTQTLQGLGAGATRAGAFGGSRQGVLEAQTLGQFGQQMGDVIGQGYQQAFDRAMGYAGSDIDRLNQAQINREAMRQAAAGIQAQGASGLSQAANQLRQVGFADADVLRTLGAEERGLQQSQMESDYADYLRSQAFPYQQLQARLSPLGYGSQVAGAAPTINQPSQFQSLLGTLGSIGSTAYMLNKGFSGFPDSLNPFS
jgi:hypothetical protein